MCSRPAQSHVQQTGASSSNLKRQLRETSSLTADASPRSDVARRRYSASSKVHSGCVAMGGVAAAEEFAGAKLGDAELAGQCVAAASLADIGRAEALMHKTGGWPGSRAPKRVL